MCLGETVTFATWYPNVEERAAQRKQFKPLTVAPDAEQKIDGDLSVPIRNTFAHPITATVSWRIYEKAKAKSWIVKPTSRSVEIAPGEEGKIAFRLRGTTVTYKAMPAAKIEMFAGGQVVLRHEAPLRACPQMMCRKARSAPGIDGELRDLIWTSAGGLKPQAFFRVGHAGRASSNNSLGFAYDNKNLYVAHNCSGMDVPRMERSPQQRHSQEFYQSDHVQILIDPAGIKQAYLGFVVTPAGGQSDYRAYYYGFAGQCTRKRDWRADWQAAAGWQKDGYSVEMAISSGALGSTPKAGDMWRLNVVVQSRNADGKTAGASWSTPEGAFSSPSTFWNAPRVTRLL